LTLKPNPNPNPNRAAGGNVFEASKGVDSVALKQLQQVDVGGLVSNVNAIALISWLDKATNLSAGDRWETEARRGVVREATVARGGLEGDTHRSMVNAIEALAAKRWNSGIR